MIKFFRKIRQKTLTENKFSNYLLYAVGEIVLVVIGILLALQINNWNENRKLKLKEVSSIKNLVEEIEFNNNVLQVVNKVDSTSLVYGKKMLALIKNKDSKFKDSMSYDFGRMLSTRVFISRRTAYENLKSIDINVVRSDSVRMNISFIYDGLYSFMENQQNNKKNEALKKMNNLIQNNFEILGSYRILPNDYEALKKNKKFTNALSFYIYSKQVLYRQNVEYYLWLEKSRLGMEEYLMEIENEK